MATLQRNNGSRQRIIEKLCTITGIVYNSIGDYTHASDCICDPKKENVAHDGQTLDYILQAVVEKLQRDGYEIDLFFDEKEINTTNWTFNKS